MDVRPGPSSAASSCVRSPFEPAHASQSSTSTAGRTRDRGSAAEEGIGGRSRSLDVCASRISREPLENASDTRTRFVLQHSNVQMSPVAKVCYSTLPISKNKEQAEGNVKQYKTCGNTQPRKRRQQHYSSLL